MTVERVLTDNGSAYVSAVFAHVAHRARVRLIRSRPRHPQTNGKAERFIQTLIRGWAYAVAYPSSWRRTLALRPWLWHDNVERPHAALAYQPPCVLGALIGMNQRAAWSSTPHGRQHGIEHELAVIVGPAAQPTIRRENRSMTTAR
jgi:hypothetical protein